jgi:AcrR family transcriptional regulator
LAGLSTKVAVGIGKPGRPANDPIRERLRIYRAARPLILANGVRGTTMDGVARAACLSPGGIYHYFASKRRLVLYGLEPEALSRACADEAADLSEALVPGGSPMPAEVIELYVAKSVRMLEFVRPAVHAAIELGRPELRRGLAAGLKQDADFLVSALSRAGFAFPGPEDCANAIRRTILGFALDEGVPPAEARRHLEWLFGRLLPQARATRRVVVPRGRGRRNSGTVD